MTDTAWYVNPQDLHTQQRIMLEAQKKSWIESVLRATQMEKADLDRICADFGPLYEGQGDQPITVTRQIYTTWTEETLLMRFTAAWRRGWHKVRPPAPDIVGFADKVQKYHHQEATYDQGFRPFSS